MVVVGGGWWWWLVVVVGSGWRLLVVVLVVVVGELEGLKEEKKIICICLYFQWLFKSLMS